MIKNNDQLQLKRDNYKILAELGSGGQGIVWQARRLSDDELVALKSVNIYQPQQHYKRGNKRRRKISEVKALVERAWEEINFLSDLGEQAHDHYIVACLDQGVITDKHYGELPIMVMPLYERDLDAYSYDYHDTDNEQWQFSINDLLKWTQQIATALAFIHQRHNDKKPHVHRDIKPANIMLDQQGNIGLTDFGIARTASHIGTSSVVATHYYCAPEQRFALFRKQNHHKQYFISPAADCYSLGITLHELLAGATRAQDKISDDHAVEIHNSQLLPAGEKNTQKIGHLGKAGGLTVKEKQYVRRQLNHLIQGSSSAAGDTILFQHIYLPDLNRLANDFANYLTHILSPWPQDRPDAATIQQWSEVQQYALQPTLESFTLTMPSSHVIVGATAHFTVSIQGRGLSSTLNWLELLVDKEPASYDAITPKKTTFGYLQADKTHDLHFSCSLPEEVGNYRIRLLAYLTEREQTAETLCEVRLSAEQLWQLGRHEEALMAEIRQQWLMDYQQDYLRQIRTLPALSHLVEFYQSLQQRHGNNKVLEQHIEQAMLTPLVPLEAQDKPVNYVPQMQFIQGGTFQMSSPKEEKDRRDNEQLHEVTVNDFFIAKTLVTVKQYMACVEAGHCRLPAWLEEGSDCNIHTGSDKWYKHMGNALTDDYYPIVGVSWQDAVAYTKWLSNETGDNYRLPTEAEWEYAARAGTKTAYPWGNEFDKNNANSVRCKRYRYTSPVGSFKAYGGLYDMHGNVWEWTCSAYSNKYNGSESKCINENTNDSDSHPNPVLRGGSWINKPFGLRSAIRYWNFRGNRSPDFGFRATNLRRDTFRKKY